MTLTLLDGLVLHADGVFRTSSIRIQGACIEAMGDALPQDGRVWNLRGKMVLPGMIDLHGDAFENQVMPRPGVFFPLRLALDETDRQMLANGITTAYHGLTYSWEPGLRGEARVRLFMNEFNVIRHSLNCDTRLHLRFETANLEALSEVEAWIENGLVDLLGLNDHVDMIFSRLDNPHKMQTYTSRSGLGHAAFADLVRTMAARRDQVPAAITRLAETARRHAIPMASHDDASPESRRWFHNLGCRLCEFPVNQETANAAIRLGDSVILGAPNAIRNQSHDSRLAARQAIHAGTCSVLSSDYYYPSMLHAPFALHREEGLALGPLWSLVAGNAAKAVGLDDRGEVTVGKRADLLVVSINDRGEPLIEAVLVAGTPVLVTGSDVCAWK